MLDVAVAFGFALSTQLGLARFHPSLALARWAATEGCVVKFWPQRARRLQ